MAGPLPSTLVTLVLPRGWSRPRFVSLKSPERPHGSTGRYPSGSAVVVDQSPARCPTGPVGAVARLRPVARGDGNSGSRLSAWLDGGARLAAPVRGRWESHRRWFRKDSDSHLDRTPLRISRPGPGNPSARLWRRRNPS